MEREALERKAASAPAQHEQAVTLSDFDAWTSQGESIQEYDTSRSLCGDWERLVDPGTAVMTCSRAGVGAFNNVLRRQTRGSTTTATTPPGTRPGSSHQTWNFPLLCLEQQPQQVVGIHNVTLRIVMRARLPRQVQVHFPTFHLNGQKHRMRTGV